MDTISGRVVIICMGVMLVCMLCGLVTEILGYIDVSNLFIAPFLISGFILSGMLGILSVLDHEYLSKKEKYDNK